MLCNSLHCIHKLSCLPNMLFLVVDSITPVKQIFSLQKKQLLRWVSELKLLSDLFGIRRSFKQSPEGVQIGGDELMRCRRMGWNGSDDEWETPVRWGSHSRDQMAPPIKSLFCLSNFLDCALCTVQGLRGFLLLQQSS